MSHPDPPPPPGSEPEQSPDDSGPPNPPMYLIEEDEADDILHPVYATTFRTDAPPGTPGVESILFRQEDYTESGDEHWEYAGLVSLVPAVIEYDDDATPEELEEARAEETDEWDYPPQFSCPRCESGEAHPLHETISADSCLYTCADCERLLVLEVRSHIRNAAALFVNVHIPGNDASPDA